MTRLGKALCMSLMIGGAWISGPSIAHSAPERVALIETTVLLEDTSDAGISAAVDRAVNSAARAAMAMGLSWVQLQRAYVSGGYVGVQVLAATESLDSVSEDEAATAQDQARPDSGTLTRL